MHSLLSLLFSSVIRYLSHHAPPSVSGPAPHISICGSAMRASARVRLASPHPMLASSDSYYPDHFRAPPRVCLAMV